MAQRLTVVAAGSTGKQGGASSSEATSLAHRVRPWEHAFPLHSNEELTSKGRPQT